MTLLPPCHNMLDGKKVSAAAAADAAAASQTQLSIRPPARPSSARVSLSVSA